MIPDPLESSFLLTPFFPLQYFLPSLVGHQKASYLLLSGKLISGKEAERLGVAMEAVEPSAVVPIATQIAQEIAESSPTAVRSCTRALRLFQEDGALDRALWNEAAGQSHSYASKELVEGLDAIEQKRAPRFSVKDME